MRHFYIMGLWFRKKSSQWSGIELGPPFPSDIGAEDGVALLSAFSCLWSGHLDQVPLNPVNLRSPLPTQFSLLRAELLIIPAAQSLSSPPTSICFSFCKVSTFGCIVAFPNSSSVPFLLITRPQPSVLVENFYCLYTFLLHVFRTHSQPQKCF